MDCRGPLYFVVVLAMVSMVATVATAGCVGQDAAPTGPAPGTAVLAAEDAPSITILSPANNTDFDAVAVVSIPVAVDVSGGVVGPGDLHIAYLLDGAALAEVTDTSGYTFADVPCGYHQLAAQLVSSDGAALPNAESVATVVVRVRCPCEVTEDCDDGNPCSAQFCNVGTCSYGPIAGCCQHDLQCPWGWSCDNDTCKQCATSSDCEDGNPCTAEFCTVDGLCDYIVDAECCNVDQDCDDGLFCTTDTCAGPVANTCLHVESEDPMCCNVHDDCIPEDPCVTYMCYVQTKLNKQWCRYGPPLFGCCNEDSDCGDANPCTLDVCVYDEPGGDSGACSFQPDPATPNCCLSHNDCDDGDPGTIDACVANTCENVDDPLYCELPPTSAIVIHELMVAPGDVPDEAGEWIELFNASDQIIDLVGWTLATSTGQAHTISLDHVVGSASITVLVPGVHFVLARSHDSLLNGGFIPHYEYGQDLDLPDPWENNAGVVHTLTLHDPAGDPVDTITYDSATWPLEDHHSLELTHPWADNTQAAHWRAAGHSKYASFNVPYGNKNFGLLGSPKAKNKSSALGILHGGCVAPDGSHFCAEGRCNQQSHCEFPIAAGCCEVDDDCVDADPCNPLVCNAGAHACVDSGEVTDCCSIDAECEDDNPCNLDRCLGNSCRHSPNIFPGCCVADGDCDDGDPCTVAACDVAANACLDPVPVDLPGGLQCCKTSDECDDGDLQTLDVCDPTESVCVFPPDVEFCDDDAAPCDDGNPCTDDSCHLVTSTCAHDAVPGCCVADGDCPSDGDPCTEESCDVPSTSCSSTPIADCCVADSECDDGQVCTADSCTNNACHASAIDGCCLVDGECDDGSGCTADSCDLTDHTCLFEGTGECCTPNAGAAQLLAECGLDPDGPALLCWTWSCDETALCAAVQAPECCTEHADCDDSDGCTVDVCGLDAICKHLDNPTPGCCATHEECAAGDYCDGGTCSPKLPDGEPCDEHVACESSTCAGGVCAPPSLFLSIGVSGYALADEAPDGSTTFQTLDGKPGGRGKSATHVLDWGVIEVE